MTIQTRLPRWRAFAAAFAFALAVPDCAFAQPATAEPLEPQIASVRVAGAGPFGRDVEVRTEVFRPDGDGPFPVVLFLHGRASGLVARQHRTIAVPRGHARYWLDKGFAVIAPIRPGYGETSGIDPEAHGARYDGFGNCIGLPDFESTAEAAVRASLATLDWARAQPWIDRERMLVEGVSAGGFTAVALGARTNPGVVGYINFSGGLAGDPVRAPGRSCGAKELTALMARWGATTRVPNIWLYAENDQFWGPEAPRTWHAAFKAGGSPTTFVQTAPVPGADGHQLLPRGGALWSAPLDRFVREVVKPARRATASPPG